MEIIMYAYLVRIYRYDDHTQLDGTTLMFGENEKAIKVAVQSLFPEHTISAIERAPWLDKPTAEPAINEFVPPAGYTLVPIEPSTTAVKRTQVRLRNRGVEIEDYLVRLIWDLMVQHS